jgi:acyl carrier protein
MTMPASTSEIVATVTGIAAAELGVPAAVLAPDTDLRAIEGIDSVKVLRMIARIERKYDVELSDEDVFSLTTIDGTASAVSAALAEQMPAERATVEQA